MAEADDHEEVDGLDEGEEADEHDGAHQDPVDDREQPRDRGGDEPRRNDDGGGERHGAGPVGPVEQGVEQQDQPTDRGGQHHAPPDPLQAGPIGERGLATPRQVPDEADGRGDEGGQDEGGGRQVRLRAHDDAQPERRQVAEDDGDPGRPGGQGPVGHGEGQVQRHRQDDAR